MGQFLISNKDRGTTVTPSQPHTGTEVQVQNTGTSSRHTEQSAVSRRTTSEIKKTKKLGLVPPNGEMTTTRGSFSFFGQQYPTNPSQHYVSCFFFLQSSFGSGSFLMPLFFSKI